MINDNEYLNKQLKDLGEQLQQVTKSKEEAHAKLKSFDELQQSNIEATINEKIILESKLKAIMHEVQEVSHRNMFLEQQCENYLVLEQSNERLKLQNDKLSRQLDETLVSIIILFIIHKPAPSSQDHKPIKYRSDTEMSREF